MENLGVRFNSLDAKNAWAALMENNHSGICISFFCAEPYFCVLSPEVLMAFWHSSGISADCCGWFSCIGFACRFAVLTYDRLATRVVQPVKRLY